jgi:hypothetical protein
MSAPEYDGQPMTKREVLIARNAFGHGVYQALQRQPLGFDAQSVASRMYPLPKVTHLRVVTERSGRQWALDGTDFRTRGAPDLPWWTVGDAGGPTLALTTERVALWADLIANPTEEVEA